MEQRKRNPFIGTNMQDVFNKVKIGTYPLPNNLSWEVVFFIEGMLQKDYDERLGCKELLYIYIYKWTKTRIFSYYKAQWKLFHNINSIEAILNWSW